MITIEKNSLASLEFVLDWKSDTGKHSETCFARKVNFWRDIFPGDLTESLSRAEKGETIRRSFSGGHVFSREESRIFRLNRPQFEGKCGDGQRVEPRFGRFYPKGLLKGIDNIFGANLEPFRCVGVEPSGITADFNHPLAATELELKITVHDIGKKQAEIGGQMNHWIEVITNGPGMQARWRGKPTDFFSDDPFARPDQNDDTRFYEKPRLVTHVDDRALEHIRAVYGRFLKPGMRVLDLMSSWRSHVPESLQLDSLVGLGMNEKELMKNPRLSSCLVHDLNQNPELPFDNQSFDAIICTVSVEYMTRPFEIFRDCARILRPDGVLVHTFSNRWFPPKVIRIWTELSEFERIGLVLEYFLRSGAYQSLETYSFRGWPRPFTDQYYPRFPVSDPVYVVAGKKSIS